MIREFPRLLILGHYPGSRTGMEVTLGNLLGEWPANRVAVAANASISAMQSNYCMAYYALGKDEISTLSVLRPFYAIRNSEYRFFSDPPPHLDQAVNELPAIKQVALSILRWLLIKTGLYFCRFRYKVSSKLMNWINIFDPEIILTMLGDISTMELIIDLKRQTGRPVAIYIVDDWVHANPSYSWFRRYWGRNMGAKFRKVVEYADVHLAICQEMADEYTRLFKKKFIAFHNPVDMNKFNHKGDKEAVALTNKFIISYIGKINKDTEDGISDMIAALDGMDVNVLFQIYGRGGSSDLMRRIERSRCARLMPYAPHETMPYILQASSLVFIPLGFSALSKTYTRLSMPTKVSEAMASGAPVLVYAPNDIALTKYAKEAGWSVVVDKREIGLLRQCLSDLIMQRIDTRLLVNRALRNAIEKHSKHEVSENFRVALWKGVHGESGYVSTKTI